MNLSPNHSDAALSAARFPTSRADAPPVACTHTTHAPRKRERSKRLTKIDMRSALGLRVKELTKAFAKTVGAEQSILSRMAIERAAQLTALAEQARGKLMRDGEGTLDDLVRLERKADQAVRALRLVDAASKPEASWITQLVEAAPK